MVIKSGGGSINWNVSKRSSYSIETFIGAKLLNSHLSSKDWIFNQSVYFYAHILSKNKIGDVHVWLDGMPNGVNLTQPAYSKVWYSGGVSLSVIKNNLEVGTEWGVQLDKKYVAHQGTLKIRLEF